VHLFEYEPGKALVVDPGESRGVLTALEAHSLDLTTLLLTHHHWDHIGGVSDLQAVTNCHVVGPDKARIKALDQEVVDGDRIAIGTSYFNVIATPGHTRTSICYSAEPREDESGFIFTGDTLFIAGCGRLFESSASDMYQSLQRLAQLPDDTVVYCGHDYTVENYQFGLTIEPDNTHIQQCLLAAEESSPLSSTIGQEKQTNVFMRAGSTEAFAQRRNLKDRF
jgi:hydroxyacylglutathione hydrolase